MIGRMILGKNLQLIIVFYQYQMKILVVLLLFCSFTIDLGLFTTVPPVLSSLGDNFRTGVVSVTAAVNTQTYVEPYSSPLPNNAVTLAVSMEQYLQGLYSNDRVYYNLYSPSSNYTHAVIRTQLPYYSLVSRYRVKYLACSNTIISSNFLIVRSGIWVSLSSLQSYDISVNQALNTTGTFYSTLWPDYLNGYKNGVDYTFALNLITSPTNLIRVTNNANNTIFINARIVLIFFNEAVTNVSGYNLAYSTSFSVFSSSESFALQYSSWIDTFNIICGTSAIYFSSNFIDFSISLLDYNVSVSTSMTWPAGSEWTEIQCFVAAYRMCPTTHPYYDPNQDLCTNACVSGSEANKTCFYCPSNCLACNSSIICINCQPGYSISTNYLCDQIVCPPSTFINNQTYTCDPCPQGCSTCYNSIYCAVCLESYFLFSSCSGCQGLCFKCYLGWNVIGGCTTQNGCLEVPAASPEQPIGICIGCDTDFTLKQGSCECKQGSWKAGNYCTSVVGCISTKLVLGNVVCQFCDLMGHFVLNSTSNQCQCAEHYALSGQSCQQLCGDGVVIKAECDDGNTEDGDGCSSQCQVEPKYRCSSTNSGPSVCQFILGVKVSLVKTKRVGADNKGIFTFVFEPDLPRLKSFDLNNFFNFSCDSILNEVTWAYQDGEVTAGVSFGSDLEGKEVIANFTFNKFFIPYDSIMYSFTVKSDNLQLLFLEDAQKINIYKYVFLAISIGTLLLLLFGSFLHKMAGVELIHSLQLIYYLHFAFQSYTPTISTLQSLSLVTINNLHWQGGGQNFQTSSKYQIVPFSVNSSATTLAFLAIPALLSLLVVIIYLLTWKYAGTETQEFVIKYSKKVYHGFIFPSALAFLLPYLLAKISLSFSMAVSPETFSVELVALFSLVVLMVGAGVLSHELKYLLIPFRDQKDKETFQFRLAKRYYLPVYILYFMIMAILLWIWQRKSLDLCLIPMGIVSALMILIMLTNKAYLNILDRISFTSNMLLKISFLLVLYLRNKGIMPDSFETDQILCMGIAGVSSLCLLLTAIRVGRQCFCQRQTIAEKKKKKINNLETMAVRQQKVLHEMMRQYVSKNSPGKQALLDNQGRCNNQEHRKFIKRPKASQPIHPEQKKKMDEVLKTFKRKSKKLPDEI